jgi:hypothetical protein
MIPIMKEAIDIFITKLRHKSINKETFDILPVYQGLAMDIIGRCAFGVKINSQEDKNFELFKSAQNTSIFKTKM